MEKIVDDETVIANGVEITDSEYISCEGIAKEIYELKVGDILIEIREGEYTAYKEGGLILDECDWDNDCCYVGTKEEIIKNLNDGFEYAYSAEVHDKENLEKVMKIYNDLIARIERFNGSSSANIF